MAWHPSNGVKLTGNHESVRPRDFRKYLEFEVKSRPHRWAFVICYCVQGYRWFGGETLECFVGENACCTSPASPMNEDTDSDACFLQATG